MQILAFESIQVLKENFREDVEEFDDSCPRMCKSRFLANGSSGYALSEIYEKLGETKVIHLKCISVSFFQVFIFLP